MVEENKKNVECIFCKIIKGELNSDKVYEDDNFIGILDANPKTEGHTLVIPKKHYENILEMPSSLSNELIDAIKTISLDLINQGKGEGVNVFTNVGEASGQVVFHLHIHIIPRKKGDGLKNIALP